MPTLTINGTQVTVPAGAGSGHRHAVPAQSGRRGV